MNTEKIICEIIRKINDPVILLPWKRFEHCNYPPFSSNQNVVIFEISATDKISEAMNLISLIHNEFHEITFYKKDPKKPNSILAVTIPVNEIQVQDDLKEIEAIFIPASKTKVSMLDFQELVAHLRAPDGCPWDRKQTHKSLRPNLIEEAYEVISALDAGDRAGMQEELGDLLLQIVLHAQIASESGDFNLEDVITGIQRKLVYRHPHVFANTEVSDAEEVIKNWEVLKAKERKKNHKDEHILHSVPSAMPALSLAQAYQKRAARVGFDWRTIEPVKEKVLEELQEVQDAENAEEKAKELGDTLFALVNLVRWYGFDAESVLRESASRFAARFEYIEDQVKKQGKTFAEFSLEELDSFWDEAKKNNL